MQIKRAFEIILELAEDNMIDIKDAMESDELTKHYKEQREALAIVNKFIDKENILYVNDT